MISAIFIVALGLVYGAIVVRERRSPTITVDPDPDELARELGRLRFARRARWIGVAALAAVGTLIVLSLVRQVSVPLDLALLPVLVVMLMWFSLWKARADCRALGIADPDDYLAQLDRRQR